MKTWTMPTIEVETFVPNESVAICITPGAVTDFHCGQGIDFTSQYPGGGGSSNPWYVFDISADVSGDGRLSREERSSFLGHWGVCSAHGDESTKLFPGFITWSNDGDAAQHEVYYWSSDTAYHVVGRKWAEEESMKPGSAIITNAS